MTRAPTRFRSASLPDEKARRVVEKEEGDVEGIAKDEKADDLVDAVRIHGAGVEKGLVGHDAHDLPADPRKGGDDALAEERLKGKEGPPSTRARRILFMS